MNCKVSIIIPVYNVGNYLRFCLNTVLEQTFTDFEVILVDDGSTDSSGIICDEYATKDKRIRVFHKENGGVSSARNLALDRIQGEWVYFCDADDMLFENSLEILYENVSEGIDSVCCGYVKISESNDLLSYDRSKYSEIVDSSDALIDFYHPLFSKEDNVYLWNRLLRSSIISCNKLRFHGDFAIKEDGLFLVQYLCRCKGKHKYSSIPVYKYRKNLASVMNTYGQNLNSKTASGLYAGIECSKEIQRYSDNASLIKLSREFVARRFLYLLFKSLVTRKINIKEVGQVTKKILSFVSVKDVINACRQIIKKRLFVR